MRKPREKRNPGGRRNTKENRNAGERKQRRIRPHHILIWLAVILLTAAVVIGIVRILRRPVDDVDVDALLEDAADLQLETETESLNPVPRPDIDEQLLTINDYSRPVRKRNPSTVLSFITLGIPRLRLRRITITLKA